jgi:HEAT repeat protein
MAYSEVFVVDDGRPARGARSVVIGVHKLICRVPERRFELFDLARDPGEKLSLAGSGDPAETVLRGVLEAWDRVIDRGAPRPAQPVAERVERALAGLTDEREDDARTAAIGLECLLLTPYGTLNPEVAQELGPAAFADVFGTLAAVEPRVADIVAPHVIRMIGAARDPSHAPALRRVIDDPRRRNDARVAAALALALVDDPHGIEILRAAASHPLILDKSDLGWSLVRLGDGGAADWFQAVLRSARFGGALVRSIEALPRLRPLLERQPGYEDLPPARAVRGRVFEEDGRHREVNLALVEALSGDPHEEAILALVRLTRDEDESVRGAAASALAAVMTPADLATARAAMDDEMDADSARVNRQPELAAAGYRSALAKGRFLNVGARLRLARALHEAGRIEEARAELLEVERRALIALDRALARRRIEQLAWSRDTDPAEWKCTVLEAHLPKEVPPGIVFASRFRIRNDGSQPWWGGFDPGATQLALRLQDDSGAVVERPSDHTFVNRLAEEGVNPGEEIDVMVLGVGPDTGSAGRLSLSFECPRVRYPNGGVVWRQAAAESTPSSR